MPLKWMYIYFLKSLGNPALQAIPNKHMAIGHTVMPWRLQEIGVFHAWIEFHQGKLLIEDVFGDIFDDDE